MKTVSPARGQARKTARTDPERAYKAYSIPGPSLGWVSDHNLAMSQPGAAFTLDNIFPTATGGVLRRGASRHTDIATSETVTPLSGAITTDSDSPIVSGAGTLFLSELAPGDTIKIDGFNYVVDAISSDTSLTLVSDAATTLSGVAAAKVTFALPAAVKTLFAYEYGGIGKLFAGTDGGIYDATVSGPPLFMHLVSNGYWATAQYTTTDGVSYVRGVNGVDPSWLYDGTSFTTSGGAADLTFKDEPLKDGSDLNFAWVFKNRFFFIEKDSLNAWYLPVGQIGGELEVFSLGGAFPLGGTLIWGGVWSIEAGDGLNNYCVFATDKGEVAVFSGENPGEAQSWMRVGVYFIGRPKGPRAFAPRGGDVIIATDVGLVPLSNALQKDAVTAALSAISAPIENEWRETSRERVSGGWPVRIWSAGQMAVVALPTDVGQDPIWFVANARTNKWCRFTGWDATSIEVFSDRMFYGASDGKIYEANVGGSDDGAPYTGVWVPTFDQFSAPGYKAIHMARPVIRARNEVQEKVSVHADFRVSLPPPPPAPPVPIASTWGAAVWGVDTWGGGASESAIKDNWRNVYGEGEAISVAVQVTSASLSPSDIEFIRTDVTFSLGEMQV